MGISDNIFQNIIIYMWNCRRCEPSNILYLVVSKLTCLLLQLHSVAVPQQIMKKVQIRYEGNKLSRYDEKDKPYVPGPHSCTISSAQSSLLLPSRWCAGTLHMHCYPILGIPSLNSIPVFCQSLLHGPPCLPNAHQLAVMAGYFVDNISLLLHWGHFLHLHQCAPQCLLGSEDGLHP